MDIAIVTGASSSLGLAISRRLIQLGFRVYGLGGDYKDCSLQNVNFKPVSCDLADPAAVESACTKILEKEKGIYLLVNNAKYFGQQPFEKMSMAEIERILKVNLLCPLVLMRVLAGSLRELQGYLIQLGSPFAESSLGGAAGAASAGGLKWMGEQLFNEYRDSGVKVCHLSPEPNRTRDARMRIRPGARTTATIDPEAVAQAIEQILQSPFGNVVTEMVIRPLRIDEPEQEPVWKIPYPDPQPIPYTVPREFIDAEEQLEEEEWKKQQLKRKQRTARKKAARKQAVNEQAGDKPEPDEKKEEPSDKQLPGESTEKEGKPSRRPRRKPRPQKVVVGFHGKEVTEKQPEKETQPKPQAEGVEKPADKSQKKPRKPIRKSAKKVANKSNDKVADGKGLKNTTQQRDHDKDEAKQAAKDIPPGKAVKKTASKAAKRPVRKRVAKKAGKHTGNEEKTG